MIEFTKMQGIGNDFVMIDALRANLAAHNLPTLARAMNNRRFGIGGDGLILIERGQETLVRMRMFNPDGSESEMCGNGIRCFAKLVRELGYVDGDELSVETGAGVLHLRIEPDGMVAVEMGQARLTRGEIGMTGEAGQRFIDQPVDKWHGTAVSMGNPHLVIFVEDVNAINLALDGSHLEGHALFPQRTNVHFIQVLDRSTLLQRTWERGAGATLACGTGACASAVAAVLTNRADHEMEVRLPGGALRISVNDQLRVVMTGPAESVFEGVWPS